MDIPTGQQRNFPFFLTPTKILYLCIPMVISMMGPLTPKNTTIMNSTATFLQMGLRLPKGGRNRIAKIKLMSIFNSNRSHPKLLSKKVIATHFLQQYLSVSIFYCFIGTGCTAL